MLFLRYCPSCSVQPGVHGVRSPVLSHRHNACFDSSEKWLGWDLDKDNRDGVIHVWSPEELRPASEHSSSVPSARAFISTQTPHIVGPRWIRDMKAGWISLISLFFVPSHKLSPLTFSARVACSQLKAISPDSGAACLRRLFEVRYKMIGVLVGRVSHWHAAWHLKYRKSHHSDVQWRLNVFCDRCFWTSLFVAFKSPQAHFEFTNGRHTV